MEEIQYLKDKSLGPGIFAVDRNLREGLWTSWTGLTKVSDMQLKCPENFLSWEFSLILSDFRLAPMGSLLTVLLKTPISFPPGHCS